MKITPILVLLPLLAMGQNSYHIDAYVDQLKDSSKVFLIYNVEDKQITDSAFVQKGRFSLQGQLQYPVSSALYLHKNPHVNKPVSGENMDYFHFFIEPVRMEMHAVDSLKNMTIAGSPINDQFAVFEEMRKGVDGKSDALREEIQSLTADERNDTAIFNAILAREKKIMDELFEVQVDFAKNHPDSYLSVILLSYVAAQPDFHDKVSEAYEGLSEQLKTSPLGKDITISLASHAKTQLGQIAPNFEQNTAQGKPIQVVDFRGRFLLIDFWASWCGPCRTENPNLVQAYSQYKDKGFEILGVSLDNPGQRKAWLDAVEKDGLTWTQVSDLKGWDNSAARLYGVNAIPASFLIDPDGRIIARDLKGKALMDKLDTIFDTDAKSP